MDANRFDALTRRLDSRRRILAAALAGIPILGLIDGATARRRQRKGTRNRRNCKHHAIKICTGDVCGKRKSNCGKRYSCHCREGKTCLPNGSCGVPCLPACPDEGFGCYCPPTGAQVCLAASPTCDPIPQQCATTADCPLGFACDDTGCGPGGAVERRCVPLCGV